MNDKINDSDRILKVGNEELYIKQPSLKDTREARKVYNQAFKDALDSGAYLRNQLDDILRERGLWDDTKQAKYTGLVKELNEHEKTLAKGGIKLSKAREISLAMRKLRAEMRLVLIDKISYDVNTAEGQADQVQFDSLLSLCVVYNSNRNKLYFKNYEDYLERSNEPATLEIATLFSKLYYNTLNSEKDLPENKFLQKWKFVNDNMRLIDKDGKLINVDGHHINEEGRLIKWNGDTFIYVDIDGNELDDEGNYKVEFTPFLDDDDEPIIEDGV